MELPSDLTGFTHIPMGEFKPAVRHSLPNDVKRKLREWVELLPQYHVPCGARVVHPYSGKWRIDIQLRKWRGHTLMKGDAVESTGEMTLIMDRSGDSGFGLVRGRIEILLRGKQARVWYTDKVTHAACERDGTMEIRTEIHAREAEFDMIGLPPEFFRRGEFEFVFRLKPVTDVAGRFSGPVRLGIGRTITTDGEIRAECLG